jgi:hypothetical protein
MRRLVLVTAIVLLAGCSAGPKKPMYEIAVGQTMEFVENNTQYGTPRQKVKTTTSSGTREVWIYSFGMLVFGESGRLELIQKY